MKDAARAQSRIHAGLVPSFQGTYLVAIVSVGLDYFMRGLQGSGNACQSRPSTGSHVLGTPLGTGISAGFSADDFLDTYLYHNLATALT